MDNKWFQYNFLLIDKTNDFFYFKDMKEVANYLNLTKAKINAIMVSCKKSYNYRSRKYGCYIQCLYNNPFCRQPENPKFIWDWVERKEYNHNKYNPSF